MTSSLASIPSFSPITSNSGSIQPGDHAIALPEVAKTGLGSSAAMTTAVVAGILQYLGSVKLAVHGESKEEETELELVHMVSQAAHCAAQGKVGSGFDVSSAVFGSQRYVRFSPSVLLSAQVCLASLQVSLWVLVAVHVQGDPFCKSINDPIPDHVYVTFASLKAGC